MGGVDEGLRVGVGGGGFLLDFVEGGVVVGHEVGEAGFDVVAGLALQAETFGGFADAGHGDLGHAPVDLAGEQATEDVRGHERDAGFGVEGRRYEGRIANGCTGAKQAPMVVADAAPVHGGIGAADAVVLDVLASASRHFSPPLCFQRDRQG